MPNSPFLALTLLLAATASSVAQTSVQAAAPNAGDAAPYTLKAGTQRVLVDVIVKDKSGHPVHGLKQSDFVISENGLHQDIREFDEHIALTAAQAAVVPRRPTLGPGEFTNFVPTPPNSALNIILLDTLNTAQSDQQYVRQQALQYLQHARPDSRTAIFGLTTHLILLQGFSSDPELLARALNYKDDPKASPLRDDTLGNNAGADNFSELEGVLGRAGFTSTLSSLQAFEAVSTSFQQQLASQYTLDALNQLGRSMINIPGRKNLIWFTGNFPTGLFPGDNDPNVPYGQFAGLENEFRETVNLLTTNQIAIYPVDAQGLRTMHNNNASQSNSQYGSIKEGQGRNGLAAAAAITKESNGIADEHLGMAQIAHDTGGEPFYNNSDLTKAIDQAISSGSNYYTLAYSPANPEKKTLFRNISVKINGESYKLSYRRGYYTDVPDLNTVPGNKLAAAPAAPVRQAIRTALLQGGPEPTEILLRVRATPASAGNELTTAPGNQPNPDASKIKPPYRTYQVDYAASMHSILVRKSADERFHVDVDFITYVYDMHGNLINAQSNTIRSNYTAAQLAGTLRTGLPFSQNVSVPQSGEHFLRVAVHDNISNKVGAVEIPVSTIARLPVTAPFPGPTTSSAPPAPTSHP